jgi:hypothetical protein
MFLKAICPDLCRILILELIPMVQGRKYLGYYRTHPKLEIEQKKHFNSKSHEDRVHWGGNQQM